MVGVGVSGIFVGRVKIMYTARRRAGCFHCCAYSRADAIVCPHCVRNNRVEGDSYVMLQAESTLSRGS
jgi:hypothetical protein